jgi:hypothetical protein
MGQNRDEAAVALAESWWPNRYVGDLNTADWARVYEALPPEEVAEYERCKQSVIDARRSANANEGLRVIG